jgi:hypothetical protein
MNTLSRHASRLALATTLATTMSAGCVDAGADADAALVAEAKGAYPTAIDVHKMMSRSCAPNAGVCHNTSNYPDLSTPASVASTLDAWCNLAIPDPTQGFDHCERQGDVLVSGTFRSEVAYVEQLSEDTYRIGLRDAVARSANVAVVRFESAAGDIVFDPIATWGVTIALVEGERDVILSVGIDEPAFTEPFIAASVLGLVQGDANRNATFGADVTGGDDNSARVIVPGSLERSYLWGRVTATVPGSRMPLANAPLTEPEYVALACYIQGLPADGVVSADAAIDYDGCAYAKAPERHAIAN